MRTAIACLALAAGPAVAAADACPDLTMLQRAAGAVTWANFLQLSGIALGAAGLLLFCSGVVRRFLLHVRLVEALLWAITLGLAVATPFVPTAWQLWTGLAACLLLPGAGALTVRLRSWSIDARQAWALLAAVWAALALLTQQPAIGFLAVVGAMTLLGLSVAVLPLCYCFGFRDARALVRAPAAGAIVAIVFAAVEAAQWSLGPLDVFRAGALWLGSFAWFLGLLILSNRWLRLQGGYLASQAVTLVSLVGALGFGLLFAVRELVTMASVFLLFWLAAKVVEVPLQGRMGLGLKLLAAGGVVSGAWYAWPVVI